MKWLERRRARRRYAERVARLTRQLEAEDWAAAEDSARFVAQEARRLHGVSSPERIAALYALSSLLLASRRPEEAEPPCREAVELARRDPTRSDPPLSQLLLQLSAILEARGDDERLAVLLGEVVKSYQRMRAPDAAEQATVINRLALCLGRRGEGEQALRLFERAASVRREAYGQDDPGLSEILYNAATLRLRAGEDPTGELERARSLCRDDALAGKIAHNLAVAQEARGERDEARHGYRRALALLEQHHGPDAAALRPTLVRLARLEHADGRFSAATAGYTRALALARVELGEEHAVTERIATWLGDARSETYR